MSFIVLCREVMYQGSTVIFSGISVVLLLGVYRTAIYACTAITTVLVGMLLFLSSRGYKYCDPKTNIKRGISNNERGLKFKRLGVHNFESVSICDKN